MKKILALVMAMALLVCSAAVFTVSAAEATFDELVAAEKQYSKVSADMIEQNNDYHVTATDRIQWSNKTEGGVHVRLNSASSARLGVHYKGELKIDGTHFIIENLDYSQVASTEKQKGFALLLGSVAKTEAAEDNTLLVFDRQGNVCNYSGGGYRLAGSDVIVEMYKGSATLFEFAEKSGNVIVTITNKAGVASFELGGYGTQWTDHSKGYINFATQVVDGVNEFDIVAFHGGNGLCSVEAAQWFDNVTESDSDIHEATLSDWDVFTDFWAANGRVWATEAANGGINVRTLSHPQLTLGVQTKSMVKLNGAHIVLDNISANTPSLWMAFGTYTAEDANVGFGGNSPLVSFDFNTNSITNIVVGGATLLEGSAVVAGMKSGKTVLSFEVKDNEVYMTLTNTAGTATVKFSLYGDVWTDRSEAYISFCHRHNGGTDSYTTYDIVAFHDGAEECGLTLKAKKEAGDKMVASLAAAASGATVKLTGNAAADSVVVKPGVTLDLNGYTLEADYAAFFGDVVGGTLEVAKENVMLSEDNAALPVWNGSAYVFVAAPTFQDQSVTNGSNVKYTFLPTFDADVHGLLAAGAAASDVTVTVRLTWTAKEGGKATQRFVYSDEFVQTVVNSYNGEKYNSAFTLLFNNAASLSGLTYEVEVVSGTGAVFAPSKTVA